jgi:hypothetical protein
MICAADRMGIVSCARPGARRLAPTPDQQTALRERSHMTAGHPKGPSRGFQKKHLQTFMLRPLEEQRDSRTEPSVVQMFSISKVANC